jgi:hypothetical protein
MQQNRHGQRGQRSSEQPPCRGHVAPCSAEHVNELPLLVNAPETRNATPLTVTHVSSTSQRSPGERPAKRAASASSGVTRYTHR